MTRLALTLILAGLAAGPTLSVSVAQAEGYSGTITGKNGGTATFSGSCSRGEGGTDCSRDSLLTGPNGHTATRKLDRSISKGKISTTVTTTGEDGRSFTRTREWSR